jgi:hypothetical protein
MPEPREPDETQVFIRPTDPFAALEQEIAHAVATKLSDALRRYATPALIPLVVEEMRRLLTDDDVRPPNP